GVRTAVFPAVVTGDDGRAAMAFYGTKDKDPNSVPSNFRFQGLWHLYVAHTFDAGDSWITVNATPNDPLQRGGLHLGGGGDVHRNLLDFFDAAVDEEGRVVVGYADGCRDACVQAPADGRGNSYGAFGIIARQTGGRRMFANFDETGSTVPGAPRLTVTRNGSLTNITWSQSEDGGLAITRYEVFRAAAGGAEQSIASLGGSATGFIDQSGNPQVTYSYRVVAENSLGPSCSSNAVTADPRGSSCVRPGLRVVDDRSGDQTGGDPAMDIEWLAVAEPFYADGSRKLELTMKVASLATLPRNAMWRILWNYPDPPGVATTGFVGRYYAGMNTDNSGVVSFEYGIVRNDTTLVVINTLPPRRVGDADPESTFSPDGTIRIVLSADKIGNADAGDVLGAIVGRTFPVRQNQTLRSDSAADSATFATTYGLVGNAACESPPPTVNCFEENNPAVTYSNGWHTVNSPSATGGQFRFNTGKDTRHGLSFTFDVPAGSTGALVYHYAKSTRGGTADVYLDGVFRETISYRGASGSTNNPQFGFSSRYDNLQPGQHKFELRNLQGLAYVDRFCLESSFFTGTATAGPGQTSSSVNTIGAALEFLQSVQVPAGSQAISVMVEAASAVPLQVALIDPSGAVLETVDASSGIAVIERPVSQTGTYLIKVVNIGLGPVQVWTVATPWVTQ
ncbi:MAG TPA: fibronectin type III domain-containing protein, partial [Candidatus Binatia bacterium]|nr:fibronectin type III domain-containing protein [Candidatus Binatia bacterium]